MNSTDNAKQAPRSHGAAKVQLILTSVMSLGHKFIVPLLKDMLDKSDDELFSLSSSAPADIQPHYFTAMLELRKMRQDIEQQFHQQLKNSALALLKVKPTSVTTVTLQALDSLSLMEEDSLEESLAVNSMVEKANNRNQIALEHLEIRFNSLFKGINEVDKAFPYAPKVVADAFSQALRPLNVDLIAKIHIYKYFDRFVVSNLGPLYDAMNQQLINDGILPKLPSKVEKKPPKPEKSQQPGGGQSVEGQGSGGGQADTPEAILNQALTELFSSPLGGGRITPLNAAYANDPARPVQPVELGQLVAALSGMQAQLEAGLSLTEFKSRLSGALGDNETSATASALYQRESNLIDFISILFEYIFEDPSIPNTAKSLIGRLQIPYIKVALFDQSLLTNKEHSARLLLNRMAQACMGYESDVPIEKSPLLGEISFIVEAVIDNFKDNAAIFDTLLERFSRFLERLEALEGKVEDRLVEKHESREQMALLQMQVDEQIKERLGDIPLPKAMVSMLTGPWREVLLDTALHDGQDSLKWDAQVRFVREIARSVVPKESAEERKNLAKQIPGLIRMLREGLQQIDYDKERLEGIIGSLESMHMASLQPVLKQPKREAKPQPRKEEPPVVFRGAPPASGTIEEDMRGADQALDILFSMQDDLDDSLDEIMSYDEWTETDEEMVLRPYEGLESEDDGIPPLDDQFLDMARELEQGVWYTLEKEDGNKVRCKLIWKSDFLGDYVFADWRRKVVAEHTLKSMAYVISQHRLSPVETVPLLDRAIDFAMTRFRKLRDGGAEGEPSSLKVPA